MTYVLHELIGGKVGTLGAQIECGMIEVAKESERKVRRELKLVAFYSQVNHLSLCADSTHFFFSYLCKAGELMIDVIASVINRLFRPPYDLSCFLSNRTLIKLDRIRVTTIR